MFILQSGEYANCEGGNGKSVSLKREAKSLRAGVASGELRGKAAKAALARADALEAQAKEHAINVGFASKKTLREHTSALGTSRAQYDRENTVEVVDKKMMGKAKRLDTQAAKLHSEKKYKKAKTVRGQAETLRQRAKTHEYRGALAPKLNLREEVTTMMRGSDGKKRMVKGPGRVMNSAFMGQAERNKKAIMENIAAKKAQGYKDRAAKGQATKRKKAGIAKAKATREANKQKAQELAAAQQAKAAARNAKRRESYQAKKAAALPPANKKAKAINSVKKKEAATP